VSSVSAAVLRHRVVPNFRAEAEGVSIPALLEAAVSAAER
jgi:hypothetical protein